MGEFFVYSLFLGMLFFLFPIFVYVDGYVDVFENKCWFSISFYRFFRVYGGYFQLAQDGIVFHLSKKKAIFLPYKEMSGARKKFEVTKGFQLWRFHQIVETGGAQKIYGVVIASLMQSVSGAVFSALQTRHPFLSLRSSTLLTEENTLKISLQAATVFNGLVLTIAIMKKVLEGIINWIREKKSIALWKKRHSSSQVS